MSDSYEYTKDFQDHLRSTLPKVYPSTLAYIDAEDNLIYGGMSYKPSVSPTTFPTDATERKHLPVYSGVIVYFPDALVGVSEVSFIGNEQHNPGQPLHWNRAKSTDQRDALLRHLIESIPDTKDGLYAAKQMAWRALADLQLKIERMRNANKESR